MKQLSLTDEPELTTELLPELLQGFVRVIGITHTLAIVDRWGGIRLYIPPRSSPDSVLANLIGMEALARLCAEYGRETPREIPRCARALRAIRDRKVVLDAQARPVHEIARELALTERAIYKILRRQRAVEQADLFG